MARPPELDIAFSKLSPNPRERHEALVQAFGKYIFWIRHEVLADRGRLVESEEARDQLGSVFRAPFARLAELEKGQREVAYEFALECIDGFAREFMRLLANSGFDLAICDENAVRFRLVMEICDGATGDVLYEEVLNRGGRHFPDYWGRWLNRYGKIDRAGRGQELGGDED